MILLLHSIERDKKNRPHQAEDGFLLENMLIAVLQEKWMPEHRKAC
jgi:hypothetical protein